MRKEENEVKVRQVPILMEDGRRIVPKVFKNGDSSAPNLSADFQKDIEDFVGKSGERKEKSNGFTKRIFFQSTEEIEEVTSRTRQGLTRPRGEESVDGEGKAETREKQSRRSLPPEAGVLFDKVLKLYNCKSLMVITRCSKQSLPRCLLPRQGGKRTKCWEMKRHVRKWRKRTTCYKTGKRGKRRVLLDKD